MANFKKQFMSSRVSSAYRIETYGLLAQIYLGEYQAMKPVLVDFENVSKKVHLAVLVSSPQVDYLSLRLGLHVELPSVGYGYSRGSCFPSRCEPPTYGCNIAIRPLLQLLQIVVVESLPHFLLPSIVEALYGSLESDLRNGSKDWSYIKT